MPGGLVVGIPNSILQLQQSGLLERAFHDGLAPRQLFRGEAELDDWPEHAGTQMLFTRPGLLPAITTPLTPGVDPPAQAMSFEQWIMQLNRYGGSIPTHIPTSATANGDLFQRNIHGLGLQAGISMNRVCRNFLYQAYLSGQTAMIASGVSGDTTIRVAALNGFTDVVTTGANGSVRPVPVSATTPLSITIKNSGGDIVRNVTGFVPDNPNDTLGPGTLLLDATLGTSVGNRTAVISASAPIIYRVGGGFSVDAISSSDVLQLQDIINACNALREFNNQPHEDGWFHSHLSPSANAQVFTDQVMQRLNTSRPDDAYYQEAFLGTTMGGAEHFMNTEVPNSGNSGTLTSTSTGGAFYASDIGAEVVNNTGVRIGRVIITAKGALQERYFDEKRYVTEAGVTGKIGEFGVMNNGIAIETLRTQLILRAPLNKTMDVVDATWTSSTAFAAPTDISSLGPQRYKRAIVIEHALA